LPEATKRSPPVAILTDIEGTTTPLSFVRDVLFPYARERLALFCERHVADPVLLEVARLEPDQPVLKPLSAWMDADAKVTPLKQIQGMIWAEGYASGALHAPLYPDVAPALRHWEAAGLKLYVYSSGSVAAQKLLFGHTQEGDLTALFQGFFDTEIGGKREAASYRAICARTGIVPGDFLFLSDIDAELDAAAEAGLRCCQLVRAADGTIASNRHPVARDFREVAARFDLAEAP
jgi:enolase-phosphatase E1